MASKLQLVTRGQFLLSPFALAAANTPKVVFVAGDHEYSGESTLPLFAAALGRHYGFATEVVKSEPNQNAETNLPGLATLADADIAVFYLRWRRLAAEQLAHIEKYLKTGRPVLGLRTSSHAFNYPKGDPLESWNRWAADVFGAPPGWNVEGHTHYGHQATTTVTLNPAEAKNPILKGVSAPFTAPSWLYNVLPKYPPADAKILLYGDAVNPNKPAVRNPVAWTWTNKYGAKSFYTSLGHPGDFALEPFQRLLVNALHWASGRKGPQKWGEPMLIDVPYRGIVKG